MLKKQQALEFAGLVIAGVALLAPAYKAPFVGSITLLQTWQGWLVLLLLFAAYITVVLDRSLWTRITTGAALAVTLIFLFLLYSETNNMQNQLGALTGNSYGSPAGNLVDSFGLSWAWVPLVAGCILTLAAGAFGRKTSPIAVAAN